VPSIAPSGMIFYSKNMFPEFKGHLLVSSLKFKSLYLVKLENELPQKELVLFKKRFGRIRDIEQLNDGSILIISDEKKGGLYKVYR
jgi:glucose/arabinose dehydrogenase